jgi:SAM-dependent methyltransferase
MQNKEAEKAFFNEFAAEQECDVFDEGGYKRLLKEFSLRVKPLPNETFLDIGCGTGAFTQHLTLIGLRGIGLDISINNIRSASSKLPEVAFTVGDTEILPFRDNEFDTVTLSGILHHLPCLEKALGESYRVLKPEGRIFAYDPNGRNPAMWLYRSPQSPFSSREGRTINERLLICEEIESSLAKAHFRDVSSVGVSGITYKYVKNSLIKRLLTIYNLMDICLDNTGLSHRYGTFLISYGRKP